MQKRTIRILANANYLEHTSPLFYNLSILPLEQLVKFNTGIFMYRAYHKCLPPTLQIYFTASHCINTRHKNDFHQRFARTRKKQFCMSVSGVKLWNSFSQHLIGCKNIKIFKRTLKEQLLTSYSHDR